MRRRSVFGALGCLGVVSLAAVAIVVWAIFAAPVDTPVVGNLRYRCTLVASKTSVSVTVKGPLSGRECKRLETQTDVLPVHLVPSDTAPSEPVICTFTSSHTTVTVNGPSLLKLEQDRFCSLVKQVATSSLSSNAP